MSSSLELGLHTWKYTSYLLLHLNFLEWSWNSSLWYLMDLCSSRDVWSRFMVYYHLIISPFLFLNFQEYLHRLEEAKKYDHRILGVKQELILHHEWRYVGVILVWLPLLVSFSDWYVIICLCLFQPGKLVFSSARHSDLQQTHGLHSESVQRQGLSRG